MRGLKEYIARHGHHFTVELAERVLDIKWRAQEVISASERRVYYNISGATVGDMVFLANLFSDSFSKGKCIRYALEIVGDVTKDGYAFDAWLMSNEAMDLRKYI